MKVAHYKYFRKLLETIYVTNQEIEWNFHQLSYNYYVPPQIFLFNIEANWDLKALKNNSAFVKSLEKLYMYSLHENGDLLEVGLKEYVKENILDVKTKYILNLSRLCGCDENTICYNCIITSSSSSARKYIIKERLRKNMLDTAYLKFNTLTYLKITKIIKADTNKLNWLYYDGPSIKSNEIRHMFKNIILTLRNRVANDVLHLIIEYLLPVMFY